MPEHREIPTECVNCNAILTCSGLHNDFGTADFGTASFAHLLICSFVHNELVYLSSKQQGASLKDSRSPIPLALGQQAEH